MNQVDEKNKTIENYTKEITALKEDLIKALKNSVVKSEEAPKLTKKTPEEVYDAWKSGLLK